MQRHNEVQFCPTTKVELEVQGSSKEFNFLLRPIISTNPGGVACHFWPGSSMNHTSKNLTKVNNKTGTSEASVSLYHNQKNDTNNKTLVPLTTVA